MLPYLKDRFGNPSSMHAPGKVVKNAVEEAREQVARLIGAEPTEIYFTSGGTEANNLALQGTAMACKDRGNHIITSAIEHHAVLKTCEFLQSMGFHVTFLPVDGRGSVNLKALKRAVTRKTILISIMHANNEVGTIQPVEEIGKLAAEREVLLHTDAVQTAGKANVNVKDLCVDLLSLSAHKIYGPKGAGALYIREGVSLMPLLYGGHQEKNIRSGTENVAGIVGMGKACELAMKESEKEAARLRNLRNLLQDRILSHLTGGMVNGNPEKRLPHVLSLSVPNLNSEDIVHQMDQLGFAVSAGSACTSGRVEISHVLSAMGLPHERARGTIRFSLGRDNTRKQIEQAAHAFVQAVEKLKALSELEDSLGARKCF
jgi:cysteine desulfurase